jgi:hypothetical protein
MSTREIAIRAAIQLVVGTLVVSIFSDPIVEVITSRGVAVSSSAAAAVVVVV